MRARAVVRTGRAPAPPLALHTAWSWLLTALRRKGLLQFYRIQMTGGSGNSAHRVRWPRGWLGDVYTGLSSVASGTQQCLRNFIAG